MIKAEHISFRYGAEAPLVLRDINIEIPSGQWLAIIGANGSGKSTLARHFNGLLLPESGVVLVDGLNTAQEAELIPARQKVAFVFQNPDNQLVATSVEDDIVFGPENLGLPPSEIGRRLEEALAITGLTEKRHKAPHLLSGGEKQRVAIAGALAMRSAYMVLDEPTSMLDPQLRLSVIGTLQQLHQTMGMGLIYVTNIMEEALLAQRVVVLHEGRLIKDGAPAEIFSDHQWLREHQLALPPVCHIASLLAAAGFPELAGSLSVEELIDRIKEARSQKTEDRRQNHEDDSLTDPPLTWQAMPAAPLAEGGPYGVHECAKLTGNENEDENLAPQGPPFKGGQTPRLAVTSGGTCGTLSIAGERIPLDAEQNHEDDSLTDPPLTWQAMSAAPLAEGGQTPPAGFAGIPLASEGDKRFALAPRGCDLPPSLARGVAEGRGESEGQTPIISLQNVSYTYQPGSVHAAPALHDINMEINRGELVALIGHSGSGKSTLAQLITGLMPPGGGKIRVNGVAHSALAKGAIFGSVGLVFQYPEQQLFAETVFEEVSFGPKNLGVSEAETPRRARQALCDVGLDEEQLWQRSPFTLSGGQKRRVCLASVLAMNPGILIFDEPTAGLDEGGRQWILELARRLNAQGKTILWISHNMEEVAELAARIVVLSAGRVLFDGSPAAVFAAEEKLMSLGLDIPAAAKLVRRARENGIDIPGQAITVTGAYNEIAAWARSMTTSVES